MIIKQNNKIFRSLVSIVFLFLLSKLTEAKSGINYTQSNNIRLTNQFSIGIGTVLTKEAYKGIDTKVRLIPFFYIEQRKSHSMDP